MSMEIQNCSDCEARDEEITELKGVIDDLKDRVKHLEKQIDDQVSIIKDAADALIREL